MKQALADLKANSQSLRKRHLFILPNDSAPTPPVGETRGFRRYKVSSVGQITLPAAARQNWGIEGGGTVEVANLGFAVLVIPEGGTGTLLNNWLAPDLDKQVAQESQELLTATATRSRGAR